VTGLVWQGFDSEVPGWMGMKVRVEALAGSCEGGVTPGGRMKRERVFALFLSLDGLGSRCDREMSEGEAYGVELEEHALAE